MCFITLPSPLFLPIRFWLLVAATDAVVGRLLVSAAVIPITCRFPIFGSSPILRFPTCRWLLLSQLMPSLVWLLGKIKYVYKTAHKQGDWLEDWSVHSCVATLTGLSVAMSGDWLAVTFCHKTTRILNPFHSFSSSLSGPSKKSPHNISTHQQRARVGVADAFAVVVSLIRLRPLIAATIVAVDIPTSSPSASSLLMIGFSAYRRISYHRSSQPPSLSRFPDSFKPPVAVMLLS